MPVTTELEAAVNRGFDPQRGLSTDPIVVMDPMRALLEDYSKIPPEGVTEAVKEVAKTYHGARSETLYGIDLRPEFIDLGYDLFRDRNTLKSHFIIADILADKPLAISQLSGSINIVHASFLFHLFNWDQQVFIAKRALALLCARPDSLIIGQNIGHHDPKKFSAVGAILPFHHNASSWTALWDHVREVTGVAFSMQVWKRFDHPSLPAVRSTELHVLSFVVRLQ
ncbi:uncharacterized protein Aud_000038 [Aspergillus udagawae]|uniref:Uncharacterized protein n=1 Tax=Aspergillus udagawae TaxID=91492 RepID=A0A8E0UX73_9EURO|nr:uncharacterized protein Aud_000038 [Aspergillus udagawae]GIC84224.1 hypothetical protein Aud_000038 [Aspergillus udagawae]